MINKFEKQINTKTWNITGIIKYIAIYKANPIYMRTRDSIYDKEETDNIVFTGTKDDAIEEFKCKCLRNIIE